MASLPNSNITTTLVANTIGDNSHNIGTLCKSPRVNMWAKYKPVKFSHDTTDAYPNWWKANAGNCGIKYSVYTSIRDMVFAAEQGEIAWLYEKPNGTYSEPFRLGDFRKYNHNAPPVCEFNPMPSTIIVSKPDQTTLVTMAISGGQDNGLTLQDIEGSISLKNMYFCCGIRNESDGTTYVLDWAHSPITLAQNGITADIPVGKYPDKRVLLYYFLSSEQRSDVEAGRAAKFVPLPFPTKELYIKQGRVIITGTATWIPYSVSYTIEFNNEAAEVNYTNCRIVIRYGTKSVDDEYWEPSEIDTPINNITVYPGKYTIKGTYGALMNFDSRGGTLYFVARDQNVVGEIPIKRG